MTWTAVGTLNPNNDSGTSFTLVPTAVGDLMVVGVGNFSNDTVFATTLSSSNVTWTTVGHSLGTAQGAMTMTLFVGKVTAASTATVTVTYSGTTPAGTEITGQQFHSTVGSWTVDTSAGLNSAGTTTWPTLTPSGTGELYAGFAFDSGATAVAGSTSGYTYIIDGGDNGWAYNLNVSAASAPVWGDAGQACGFMVLMAEGGGGTASGAPRQQPGSRIFRSRYHRAQTPAQVVQGAVSSTANAGLAAGTGAALSPAALVQPNAGLATGTGAALQPPELVQPNGGLAGGTGTSQPPVVLVQPNAGLASGTGAALQPTANSAVTASAGLASGTGTSQSPAALVQPNAGLAAGTGTALQVAAPAALTHGAGAALSPLPLVQPNAGLAAGTGAAPQPVALVQPTAGLATGTGAALQPTVAGSTVANAGLAPGTGTSQPPVALAQPNAGLAAGTGAALSPTVSATGGATAGLASGTGAALQPVALVQPGAGLASGAGAALQPASLAGLAAGAGTAPSPAAQVTVNAGLASGAGSASGTRAGTALTVTATGSGGSTDIILSVRVLNNASFTQNGATTGVNTGITVPGASITPHATGSMIYGTVANGGASTAFSSIDGNTTSLAVLSDVSQGAYFGNYRSTALTASTSSATYGWAAPTGTSGNMFLAMAEILSNGGTLAEDLSTPPSIANTTGTAGTTAAFLPPSTSVLVAIVGTYATTSVAVTDLASAYTWTQLAQSGGSVPTISTVWVGIPKGTTAAAGLAHGSGTVPPFGFAQAGLAAGTGAASSTGTGAAGLASGAGTAQQPAALVQPTGGLASGTGAASSTGTGTAGLASGTGAALSPVPVVQPNAGLASGTGTAFNPSTTGSVIASAGLAHGSGAASSTGTGQAGLATGTGAALQPPSVAGLAHGAGSAGQPTAQVTVLAGLAHGTGSAFAVSFGTLLPHWGVTITEPGPNAVLTENAFRAALTLPNLGGGLTPQTKNAVLTLANLNATLAVVSLGATLAVVSLNAVISEGTMQQATLTLSEFNDMTINIAVTNNGVAYNLTSQNLNLLLKSAAGVPDNQALVFSSSGGSPAITITNAAGGLATAQIPNASLNSEAYTFYRLDVVNASLQQQTTVYGSIIWVTL